MTRRAAEAFLAFALMLAAAVAVTAVIQAGNIEKQRLADAATALSGGGDPHRGHDAIAKLGCGACHTIKGVTGADGSVGPNLTTISSQIYGSQGENTPERLIAWIKSPRQVRPDTAMPDLGIKEGDARDIAAYLLQKN
jgi:cytochrome c